MLFSTAAPLIDDKGDVVGAIETPQDISEGKERRGSAGI